MLARVRWPSSRQVSAGAKASIFDHLAIKVDDSVGPSMAAEPERQS
jgi:hypothetical protein